MDNSINRQAQFEQLFQDLNHGDSIERVIAAADRLRNFVDDAARVAPALHKRLVEPNSELRLAAAGSLLSLRCFLLQRRLARPPDFSDYCLDSARVLADLIALEHNEVGEQACSDFAGWFEVEKRLASAKGTEVSAEIATIALEAVPALRKAAQDSDWHLRYWAIHALVIIAPLSREAVPDLAEALSDKNPDVATEAGIALRALGKWAAPAVPDLIETVQSKGDSVAGAAALALGAIGVDAASAVLPLAELVVNNSDIIVRVDALQALTQLGPIAHASTVYLVRALSDGDDRVRRMSAEALASIGTGARAALFALHNVLSDEDGGVREAAAEAIRRINS